MIARAYIDNGARVIITGRNAAVCEGLAAELAKIGDCTAIPADLSQMAEIDRFAAAVAAITDRVDVLFNNAGASWGAPFDTFPEIGWDKVMDINVKSVFFLTQKLIKLLEAAASPADYARVINIGSIDGQHVSGIETYSYAASKAGVLHMTRMMAKNLAGRHIAVNAIAPGYFPSKMTAGIAEEFSSKIACRHADAAPRRCRRHGRRGAVPGQPCECVSVRQRGDGRRRLRDDGVSRFTSPLPEREGSGVGSLVPPGALDGAEEPTPSPSRSGRGEARRGTRLPHFRAADGNFISKIVRIFAWPLRFPRICPHFRPIEVVARKLLGQ